MSDLARVLDLVDEAVSRAADVVGSSAVEEAALLARSARQRLGFLGETVVIALAGGTGSGKSSLLNALAGEYVAEVAAIRPTTSQPLVWLPRIPEPGIVRLLDDMGIERRVGHRESTPVAIIDMPDTDSVVGAHRAVFESLLPKVDVVWWVVDPEKYSDRLLHREYLEPLADYQKQFVFVFNQIDRLSPSGVHEVLTDFTRRLREVGITNPVVVPVAANPPDSPPVGIDDLWRRLVDLHADKHVGAAKALVDVRQAAAMVGSAVNLDDAAALGFDDRWADARNASSAALSDLVVAPEVGAAAESDGAALAVRAGVGPLGWIVARLRTSRIARALGLAGPTDTASVEAMAWHKRPGLDRALTTLESFVSETAFAVGGPYAQVLRERFTSADVRTVVDRSADGALHRHAEGAIDAKSWWGAVGTAKWLLAAAFLGGLAWWYGDPPLPGTIPWPPIVVFASLVLGLGLTRLVDWSGRRAGRQRVASWKAAVGDGISDQLDRGLGSPMRAVLRDRMELAALLAEISVASANIASSPEV